MLAYGGRNRVRDSNYQGTGLEKISPVGGTQAMRLLQMVRKNALHRRSTLLSSGARIRGGCTHDDPEVKEPLNCRM